MGFLRFIIILFLIFLGIRLVFWLLFPSLSSKNQQRYNTWDNKTRKEGDVKIDYMPKKDKKSRKDTGDYTEYEEVK